MCIVILLSASAFMQNNYVFYRSINKASKQSVTQKLKSAYVRSSRETDKQQNTSKSKGELTQKARAKKVRFSIPFKSDSYTCISCVALQTAMILKFMAEVFLQFAEI